MRAFLRSAGRVLVVLALAAGVVVTRVALIRFDVVYGPARTAAADVVCGALLALVAVVAVRMRSATDSIARAGALVALAVALAGATAAYAPSTPTEAAAPACRGVPVAGAHFLAQTTGDSVSASNAAPGAPSGAAATGKAPSGVNARSGPGTSYPQVDRFAGDCTLGFDGYCIGAPVADLVSDLPDSRWLRVHGKDREFVASAKVLSQSREADLGPGPMADCADAGGLPQPGPPAFTPTPQVDGTVDLRVDAHGATLVGYAIHQVDPSDGSYPYGAVGGPLTREAKDPPFSGKWNAVGTAVPLLNGGAGVVELAAVTCLAADVPVMPPQVYRASFTTGKLDSLFASRPNDAQDASLLAHTACSGPD